MSIRDRVRLITELPRGRQYPTRGAIVLVDLERREVQRGHTLLHPDLSLIIQSASKLLLILGLCSIGLSRRADQQARHATPLTGVPQLAARQ